MEEGLDVLHGGETTPRLGVAQPVQVGATSRGVESANVEAGYTNHSTYCIAPGAREVQS